MHKVRCTLIVTILALVFCLGIVTPIQAASINVEPDEAKAGEFIRISGMGYDDDENITSIMLTNEHGYSEELADDIEVGSNGKWSVNVIVPESPVGDYTITAIAETTANMSTTFTVLQGISLLPDSLPDGDAKAVYAVQTLTAQNGTAPYKWALKKGDKLPSGLTLKVNKPDTSSATISGTPTKPGEFTFTVQVTDNTQSVAEKKFTVFIYPEVTLILPQLPAVEMGAAFPAWAPIASGGNGEYTWSITGLPPGLIYDPSTGIISGAPTASGPSRITLTVTDTLGGLASKVLTMNVRKTISIIAASLPPGDIRVIYKSTTLQANGGTNKYVWSIIEGALPSGLILSSGGKIEGTPLSGSSGIYAFSVQVSDGPGIDIEDFEISINDPLMVSPLPDGVIDEAYGQFLSATGGSGGYKYSIVGVLPSWLTFNSASGTIFGRPVEAGTYRFIVKATDSLKGSVTQVMTVNIIPGEPITLQLESFLPIGSPSSVLFHQIMDGLTEATGGQVTVEYHEASALGSPTDTLNRMQQGVTDYGVLVPDYYPAVFDLFEVFELPVHYPNTQTLQKAVNIMLKKGYFDEQLSGLVPCVIYGSGPYQMFSTKEVAKVEDFQGMKIRSPMGIYHRITMSLGGVPVSISGPEIFACLDKGIIDAAWADWEIGRTYQLMDVARYTLATQLSTTMYIQGLSQDSFNRLPSAGQKYLQDNFESFNLQAGTIWDAAQEEAHNLVLNNPQMTNDVLSEAEKAEMDAILAPVIAQWINDKEAKGLPARQAVTDLYDTLVSLGVESPFVLPQ